MYHQRVSGNLDKSTGRKGGFNTCQIRSQYLFQSGVIHIAGRNQQKKRLARSQERAHEVGILGYNDTTILLRSIDNFTVDCEIFARQIKGCSASCPASFNQLASRFGSCASTRNFMRPNVRAG
jgi:hypothetical protein